MGRCIRDDSEGVSKSGTIMVNRQWTEDHEWCYLSLNKKQNKRVKYDNLKKTLRKATAKDNNGEEYDYLLDYSCFGWSRHGGKQNKFGGCLKPGQSIVLDFNTPKLVG